MMALRAMLAVSLLAAANAFACGVCIDDKIASCYDHAVVSGAKAKGHAVAFFAIKGDIVRNRETEAALRAAIAAIPGVQRGTARVSLENAALSFAFDPARTSVQAAERGLSRRLGSSGLEFAHLRTL
jgi:hypothetical protein